MASEVLISISKNEIEQARLMSEYKYQLDTQSDLVSAKREGRLEGIEEGRLEEHKESMETVAQNALKEGLPIEVIHKITGLDVEIIRRLSGE